MIDCESEQPNAVSPRSCSGPREVHTLHADVAPGRVGQHRLLAPGPHDYFDTALASCKALTAIWYARHNQIPLERVETHVERDNCAGEAKEVTSIKLEGQVFEPVHGPLLTEEQKKRLYAAVSRCPIHKLMTTSEVIIETAPL